MRLIANIIWFVFCGLWMGLFWTVAGILLCITIIGIPLGCQCFKAAKLTVAPFGKTVRINFDKHPFANLLWVVVLGWEMALGYLVCGLLCCITIIGIPVGIQAFQLMKLALLPFGATVSS